MLDLAAAMWSNHASLRKVLAWFILGAVLGVIGKSVGALTCIQANHAKLTRLQVGKEPLGSPSRVPRDATSVCLEIT
jgi:hypothetical protein